MTVVIIGSRTATRVVVAADAAAPPAIAAAPANVEEAVSITQVTSFMLWLPFDPRFIYSVVIYKTFGLVVYLLALACELLPTPDVLLLNYDTSTLRVVQFLTDICNTIG